VADSKERWHVTWAGNHLKLLRFEERILQMGAALGPFVSDPTRNNKGDCFMAESEDKKRRVRRRDFLAGGGAAIAAGALGVRIPESTATSLAQASPAAKIAYAPSTGYIVYDSRLCLGCQSCMFACSLTHEGEANPALSRIQIIRDAPSFSDAVENPWKEFLFWEKGLYSTYRLSCASAKIPDSCSLRLACMGAIRGTVCRLQIWK
jgi:ferredoxin